MKDVISVDTILNDLIGHDDGFPFGDGYHDECKQEVNDAKSQLHSLLISKLPEKKPLVLEKEYSTPRELLPQEQEIKLNTNHQVIGFNSAIDDMRKSIDGLFNEM